MRIAINGTGVAGPTLAYWLLALARQSPVARSHGATAFTTPIRATATSWHFDQGADCRDD